MASEEINMDAWGLDVVLTASQKGLGTPPGLSILVASPKAIEVGHANSLPADLSLTSRGIGIPIQENSSYILLRQLEEVSPSPCTRNMHYLTKSCLCNRWLPIMKAYEAGTAAYFATPPVNLIYAYNASLTRITKSSPSLQERFKLHREVSQRFKNAAAELGLKQVPDPAYAANGMTAVSFA